MIMEKKQISRLFKSIYILKDNAIKNAGLDRRISLKEIEAIRVEMNKLRFFTLSPNQNEEFSKLMAWITAERKY